jgi:hypothetical protein
MFTRRQLIAALGFGGASLVGTGALLVHRRAAGQEPLAGPSAGARIDDGGLAAIAEFIGVLFAHKLTAEDRGELLGRLRSAMSFEPVYVGQYATLIEYIEQYARESGAAGFVAASEGQRLKVVERFMNIEPDALLPRLLAHLSTSERSYYNIRWKTIPALAMLYRRSGLPWRARGYRRWPGVPGSWSDYLQPTPTRPV